VLLPQRESLHHLLFLGRIYSDPAEQDKVDPTGEIDSLARWPSFLKHIFLRQQDACFNPKSLAPSSTYHSKLVGEGFKTERLHFLVVFCVKSDIFIFSPLESSLFPSLVDNSFAALWRFLYNTREWANMREGGFNERSSVCG